jgi:hypothetical protein
MLDNTQEIKITSTSAPAPAPAPAPKRSSWYLLTGVILGLILGLVYAWLINPVVYESSTPETLGDADKDFYRGIIAQVYAATGDLERASLRLGLLADPDPAYALGAQAQRALAQGQEAEARALALLAARLQSPPMPQDFPEEPAPPKPTPTDAPPGIPTHTLPVPTNTP